MARLTLAQIRDTVREMTETSSQDVSDSLLNLFIRDGYNRIIDLERRWPFLEVSFSFNTVAGQTSYTVNDYTADEIREVVSLVDPDHVRLDLISYEIAEDTFLTADAPSGRPMYVSYWAEQIHIFPEPNGAYELLVRGYREPEDWITAGDVPDGPSAFDIALVDYAVARVYRMQEAFAPAQEFERSFNDAVAFARRDIMKPESYAPVQLSSGGHVNRWQRVPRFR